MSTYNYGGSIYESHIITFKSAQLKFLQLKSKISVTGQEIYPY